MTQRIITIQDDFGEERLYRRYSARLPAFLREYNPKEGYRVVIERTDLLSQKRGLHSLLREAIIANRKLSDLGLPSIERDINTIICTAKLLSPQGEVLREAGAAMEILDRKDYESLETAADQRLLARCGFGGEVFDDEEDAAIAELGGGVREPAMAGEASPASLPSDAPDFFASHASASTGTSVERGGGDDSPATEAERRQIENLARRVGVAVPELKTRADVKARRSELSALARQQRTARPSESTAQV